MKMKKITLLLGALVLAVGLTACKGGVQSEKEETSGTIEHLADTTEVAASVETSAASVETSAASTEIPTSAKASASAEDSVSLAESKMGETQPEVPNPLKKVESSDDFQAIGLSLKLPENDSWYENAIYQIIDGQIAEICFFDVHGESEASVRAAKEDLGDVSGVYYKFDEAKTKIWSTAAAAGQTIEIAVQVVVEGSDFHGVLASWNYDGVNYTLWEDNGADRADTIAKMAMEIAKRSSKN